MTEVGEGVEEGVRVVGVAGGGGDVLREPENPNRLGWPLGDRLAPEESNTNKTVSGIRPCLGLTVRVRHVTQQLQLHCPCPACMWERLSMHVGTAERRTETVYKWERLCVHVSSWCVHVSSWCVHVSSWSVHVSSCCVHVSSCCVHVSSWCVHVSSCCVHVSSWCVRVSEQALILCARVCVCNTNAHTTPKTRCCTTRSPVKNTPAQLPFSACHQITKESVTGSWVAPRCPTPQTQTPPSGETKLTQLPTSLYNMPLSCLPLLTPPPPGAVAGVSGPRPTGTGGGWGELPGLCCMSGLTTPALSSGATAKITDNERHSGLSSQCRSRLRFAWSSSGRLR